MASYHNIYPGADYGLDSEMRTDQIYAAGEPIPASAFGLTTRPDVANQLKEVFEKFRTGAKAIELTGISPEILESIPKQHFDEIRRLKELAGAELTFHGPLIEPTGLTQQGWTEEQRAQAERQIWSAVERSHQLDPKGNMLVTLHTTSGLPEMETKIRTKEGEKIEELWVFDYQKGGFNRLRPKKSAFFDSERDAREELSKLNSETWTKALTGLNFHATSGREAVKDTTAEEIPEELKEKGIDLAGVYAMSKTPEGVEFFQSLSPQAQQEVNGILKRFNYGDIYIKDAYNDLHNLFNQAYDAAEREKRTEDLKKLEDFREELKKKRIMDNIEEDPSKIVKLGDVVVKGVNVLNSLKVVPETFRLLNDFATDKAAETFGNIAFQSYDKFKDSAPIISVENPPAGGGISRAKDMAVLIDKSREQFVRKAMEKGLSRSAAKEQSEKLIGATWDVGHINMLKKYGYSDEDIVKESKKIKPYLKHLHLSDNFGLEHTELPIGMGNVPMQKHLDALGEKAKKAKQIIETGSWYRHFQTSPFQATLGAFGSPIYSMKMAPAWQPTGITGEYFAGGGLNPDIHHSIYGAGFSNLPVELGGQMQGAGRSRFSGTPTE